MSIPLVQNNEKDSINTSIIAIKKNLERINSILGLVDSGSDIDTSEFVKKSDIVDVVQSGNMSAVTSNAVNNVIGRINNNGKININLQGTVWLKIGTLSKLSVGEVFELECQNVYYTGGATAKKITIIQGTSSYANPNFYVEEKSASTSTLLKILRIGYNNNWDDGVGVYLKYEANTAYANAFSFMFKFLGGTNFVPAFTLSTQTPSEYQNNIDFDLHSNGLYVNGVSILPTNSVTYGSMQPVTSGGVYNELNNTIRAFQVAFATFFTANTTVHIADFVNAVVNRYGKGFREFTFGWSNANQGYITDGTTSILMNGNFIRGYFTPIAEGYNWVRCQYLTYDINTKKTYMIEVYRNTTTITEEIYPLN